jgi:glycosyltransferase involved in cell wall biosynthesis
MVFDKYSEFPSFPNPHIRSNGFLIAREHMLRFEPHDIREKLDACIFESGENSLTTQLRRGGLSAIVAGADGGGWDVPDWPQSRTFRLQDQSNLLISDNQSRQYDAMPEAVRLTHERITWGDYLGKPAANLPSFGLEFRRGSLAPGHPTSHSRLRRAFDRLALKAALSVADPVRRSVATKATHRSTAPPRSHAVKISVLIPSKNRLELLKYAISSILVQNDASIEIVVSDNASNEDYRGYIDSLADARIVYHRLKKPVSVTENWRQALSLCSGDYIIMLGDDDALAPNFSSTVRRHLSRTDGPDVVYLAAYHYGYPGVLAFRPSGYLASVKNSEFLLHSEGPFCLTPAYARELGNAVLQFRYRFGLNAQHFLLKSTFVKGCEKQGGLYQSPYPDTFAGIAALVGAKSVVVLTDPTVIIGISPKSFGAYYFSGRHDEGYHFLGNEGIDAEVREDLESVILPGDRNNTNWLVAAEVARRRILPALSSSLSAERYRALQIASVLRDRYQQQAANEEVV